MNQPFTTISVDEYNELKKEIAMLQKERDYYRTVLENFAEDAEDSGVEGYYGLMAKEALERWGTK